MSGAFGTEVANVHDGRLRIITRRWENGEYQADVFVEDGQFPILNLAWCKPEELRALAKAIETIACDTEHQYDEDD